MIEYCVSHELRTFNEYVMLVKVCSACDIIMLSRCVVMLPVVKICQMIRWTVMKCFVQFSSSVWSTKAAGYQEKVTSWAA